MTAVQPDNAQNNMAEQVASNIDAIVKLSASANRGVTRHQRAIETITGHLGRPISLFLMIGFIIVWTLYNTLAKSAKLMSFDPPPFTWLQGIIGVAALMVTTMVLITQNRQAAVAEQRSHLDIQVNLLAEQKITKLISLVEELREDLPNVRNRQDREAEVMSQSTDPLAVVAELQKNLENAERIDAESTN